VSNAPRLPRDITVAGLTPLQLVQAARAKQWHFDWEIEARKRAEVEGTGDYYLPPHYGPLATELRDINPALVSTLSNDPDDVVINQAHIAGLAWAAAAEAGDLVMALMVRVTELEARLNNQ
jgi:hypothetical protein